jgi:hypothetical protein
MLKDFIAANFCALISVNLEAQEFQGVSDLHNVG